MSKQVLVVGAGPTGLIVAAELKKYGISLDLIEKTTNNDKYSKALSVSAASLKVFHGMGLSDTFLRHGNKMHDVYIYYNKRKVAHINKRFLDTVYNFFLSIPQPQTEKILESYLKTLDCQVKYGFELLGLIQSNNFIEVKIKNQKNNLVSSEKYDYVIGCDGSKSTVRNLIGLPFQGRDYPMHFILADFYSNKVIEYANYFVDEDGFIILIPMKNGLTRIVVKKDGSMPDKKPIPTKSEIQFYLDKYLPFKFEVSEMIWSSSAPFFNRITPSNNINRVFLAGDAYHLFSPIGGQGMNTGIQDAFNLAWKLAYVVKGQAKDELLESYQYERYIAVRKVLESTDVNTNLIARSCDDNEQIKKYMPSFSNREYVKNIMPKEFSGFMADYSATSDGKLLEGQHVPYFSLKKNIFNIGSSYEIPKIGKNIIFINKEKIDFRIWNLLKQYKDVLEILDISFIDPQVISKFSLLDSVVIVRPDGFIGYHKPHNDMENYFAYMDKFYIPFSSGKI